MDFLPASLGNSLMGYASLTSSYQMSLIMLATSKVGTQVLPGFSYMITTKRHSLKVRPKEIPFSSNRFSQKPPERR